MYRGPLSRLVRERRRPPQRGFFQGLLARFLVCLLGASALCSAACTRQIGDSCTTNVDCSPLGDRFCDLASPDGYCTIEGCDGRSCPDSGVCIQFFSLKIGAEAQCDSSLAPMAPADCAGSSGCCVAGTPGCCQIGEHCLCDEPNCGKNGACASESSERRWCMHPCGSDGDCRSGYQCRPVGSNGSLAVPIVNDDGSITYATPSYCASPI